MLIFLEIAKSKEEREKGYMFRKEAPPDSGILFINPFPSRSGLWMKNTFLPLSSAFLDSEGKILKIHKFMEPMTHRVYASDEPADYMIEIPMIKNRQVIVFLGEGEKRQEFSKELAKKLGYRHINISSVIKEVLREGKRGYIDGYIPYYLPRFVKEECVLDGFPRTISQALTLRGLAKTEGLYVTRAFYVRGKENIPLDIADFYRGDGLFCLIEDYDQILENMVPTYKVGEEEYLSWFDIHGIEEGDYFVIDFDSKVAISKKKN